MKTKTKNLCVLATDFTIVDIHMEDFEKQREKKENIYYAFSEYIQCLEDSLLHEEDFISRCLLQAEIKKMKKEQQKYYVPSMLELAFDNKKENIKIKKTFFKKANFYLTKISDKFNK